jgi:hypothetical protein
LAIPRILSDTRNNAVTGFKKNEQSQPARRFYVAQYDDRTFDCYGCGSFGLRRRLKSHFLILGAWVILGWVILGFDLDLANRRGSG